MSIDYLSAIGPGSDLLDRNELNGRTLVSRHCQPLSALHELLCATSSQTQLQKQRTRAMVFAHTHGAVHRERCTWHVLKYAFVDMLFTPQRQPSC